MGTAQLLVASNRGPVSFSLGADGSLTAHRGGGGLVSGLASLGEAHETVWVCCALGDADRRMARSAAQGRLELPPADTGGLAVRMLDIDARTFHLAYNGVANSTLWFLHHMLYATPHQPVFDAGWRREWAAYVHYNRRFAEAIAQDAAPGAKVLVQDYHLTLAPKQLRELRPDLTIGHFSHTPWAPAEYFRMLPDDIARDVLLGVLGADHAGFHSPRWGNAFLDCCRDVLGAEVDYVSRTVRLEGRTSRIGVHPLGVDAPGMRARAAAPDVESRRTALLDQIGDLTTIVRIDRTELSKNIERGLLAYRELLRTRPEWRGRIVHVAFAYPSRHDLPEYREYTAAVLRLADEIDAEFATETWRPLVLHVDDDYARSLAAYSIADILLVNPVRDGMNLVAKEGPLLSSRECALVLSTEAGAADELGDAALLVNPFDVSQTACALHEALLMPRAERAARAEQLRAGATALPPHEWLAEQLAAL